MPNTFLPVNMTLLNASYIFLRNATDITVKAFGFTSTGAACGSQYSSFIREFLKQRAGVVGSFRDEVAIIS